MLPLDLAPVMEPDIDPDIDPDMEPEAFAPFFLSAAILSWSDIIEPDIEPLAFEPVMDPDMEPLELDCANAGAVAKRARMAMVVNFFMGLLLLGRMAGGVMLQYRTVRAAAGRGYSQLQIPAYHS